MACTGENKNSYSMKEEAICKMCA